MIRKRVQRDGSVSCRTVLAASALPIRWDRLIDWTSRQRCWLAHHPADRSDPDRSDDARRGFVFGRTFRAAVGFVFGWTFSAEVRFAFGRAFAVAVAAAFAVAVAAAIAVAFVFGRTFPAYRVRGRPHCPRRDRVDGRPHVLGRYRVRGRPNCPGRDRVGGRPHVPSRCRVHGRPNCPGRDGLVVGRHSRMQRIARDYPVEVGSRLPARGRAPVVRGAGGAGRPPVTSRGRACRCGGRCSRRRRGRGEGRPRTPAPPRPRPTSVRHASGWRGACARAPRRR